jgi:membrane dipeptidase
MDAMAKRRTNRHLAASVAAIVVLAIFVVFFVVPAEVEKRMNRTLVPPPYAVSDRARALHATLTIADLHADSLLWNRDLLERGTRGHVDVPRLIEGNVALQAFTIVTKAPRHQNIDSNSDETDNVTLLAIAEAWPPRTWGDLTERALFEAGKLQDVARRSNGRFTLIRSSSDLAAYLDRRARDPAITAGILGVEGAHAMGGNLDNLDRLFEAGVRMMAPTHFTDNDVGGSASGTNKGGLTELGKQLIRRMESLGMIVDLAHASARTIDDVTAIATRPVVVSHTGVRGTCDNARNLSDAQLTAIARTGGVIGIGYFEKATCGVDSTSIARAIRHAVAVAGVEHVALGSDFDGTTTTPFDTSGVAQVTDALLAEGFTDDEIARIMGQNTLRLLMQGLPPRGES